MARGRPRLISERTDFVVIENAEVSAPAQRAPTMIVSCTPLGPLRGETRAVKAGGPGMANWPAPPPVACRRRQAFCDHAWGNGAPRGVRNTVEVQLIEIVEAFP
jgi:hypothetical protein